MNLLLLEPDELRRQLAAVEGRRARHLVDVLHVGVGDEVHVGVIDGAVGSGTVTAVDEGRVELRVALTTRPPPPSTVSLVLALPRPPVLRRVLQHVACVGIKHVVVLGARRVESSYWTSHAVRPGAIREHLVLGLEQGRDTVLPRVELRQRFRPFVEDELPGMIDGGTALLAATDDAHPCPSDVDGSVVLVVGPEGGFIPFERELLLAQGLSAVTLGPRPLRVEAAVSALVGRIGRVR